MSDATHTLWYCIDRKPNLSSVPVTPNETIEVVKEKIYGKATKSFSEYNARDLILTKVDVDLDGIAEDVYAGRYRFDTSSHKPLWDMKKISDVWPQLPSAGQLHVYVSPPAHVTVSRDEPPSKRPRLADDNDPSSAGSYNSALMRMRQFWSTLWQEKHDPFRVVPVRRDPNPIDSVNVPETMRVLNLPKMLSLINVVMVRDDYNVAVTDIEGRSTSDTRNVIIVGHPGIGKSILLYLILVRRLLEERRTILQMSNDHLFFFNANGVEVLPPSFIVDPELEIFQNTWALVDINTEIKKPAAMLCRDTSPFFLVMTSSPRTSQLRALRKYREPAVCWLMKPFNLSELIQARQLQQVSHGESDIENFFAKYGPSARNCYDYCEPDALHQYDDGVRDMIKEMSWDLIIDILTSNATDIKAEEGSHKVLLVGPQPNDRTAPRTTVVSKTVSQLLWARDSDEKWRNHRKLFNVLLREPSTKASSGLFFEPAFHDLCIHGTTFMIYPMERRDGNLNYIFTIPDIRRVKGSKLKLKRQQRVFFNEDNPIPHLRTDEYYQPTNPNHPSLDSFVYDPNSHQVSAFQATVGLEHDLKPGGVYALRDLGERQEIHDLKIRIIVVLFGDREVIYRVNKVVYNTLRLQVFVLQVTENHLYSHTSSGLF